MSSGFPFRAKRAVDKWVVLGIGLFTDVASVGVFVPNEAHSKGALCDRGLERYGNFCSEGSCGVFPDRWARWVGASTLGVSHEKVLAELQLVGDT